jgi:S1-C subfamily serine protease
MVKISASDQRELKTIARLYAARVGRACVVGVLLMLTSVEFNAQQRARHTQPTRSATQAVNTSTVARKPKVGFVVPVVHRIGGWKLLTLLERHNLKAPGEVTGDFVHTNIVAGYTFGTHQYIVARLPQAEVEAVAGTMPSAVSEISSGKSDASGLYIVGADRIERAARFIGLDASTGLSLLDMTDEPRVNRLAVQQISSASSAQPPQVFQPPAPIGGALVNGAQLNLLAPIEIKHAARESKTAVRVRLAETPLQVVRLVSTSDKRVARIIARGVNLKASLNGAIAFDARGVFVGMVERVTADEAQIIPRDEVEDAARRILVRRSSVPQPWLGAQGEPLAGIKLETLTASGWDKQDAQKILSKQQGVLLTVVPPFTPAALANLRPGDIVTGIGDRPITGVEDFSQLLAAAGENSKVQLTVSRASESAQPVTVQLGESLNPTRETERASRLAEAGNSVAHLLAPLGLEIVTAPATLRARLKAQTGLLVISLRQGGAAAVSGLRQGDIIERANGKLLTEIDASTILAFGSNTEVTFDVVRGGQRISITLQYPPTK